MNTPLFNFGFQFDFNGKPHSFVVVASSEDEARAKVFAMRDSQFVGRLHEAEEMNEFSLANVRDHRWLPVA